MPDSNQNQNAAMIRDRVFRTASAIENNSLASNSDRDKASLAKLKNLINHAATNSWWANQLSRLRLPADPKFLDELLGALPTLSRRAVQEHSEWMQTWITGSNSKDYAVGITSGSTGKPVATTKFRPVQDLEFAATELLDFKWQKIDVSQPFLLYTSKPVPKTNGQPIGTPFSYLGKPGPAHFMKVENSKPREAIELMIAEGVTTTFMSPAVLRIVLDQISDSDKGQLRVKNVITFADRVEFGLREKTKNVLGARIIDRYSSTEFGYLALQCPNSTHLHALQFNNLIEILDQNNRPCEPGQLGRVVVTGLSTFAMPLIRYELGDIASWGESSECGINLPVLMPEIVRQRQTLLQADGTIKNILPDQAQFAQLPGVRDFQMFIFKNRQVLFLVGNMELGDLQRKTVTEEVVKVTGLDLPVELITSKSLDWLEGPKRRSVVISSDEAPANMAIDGFRKYVQ